jgi:hypothetical protein
MSIAPVAQGRTMRGATLWLWRKLVVSFRNLRYMWNWCLAIGFAKVPFIGDGSGIL